MNNNNNTNLDLDNNNAVIISKKPANFFFFENKKSLERVYHLQDDLASLPKNHVILSFDIPNAKSAGVKKFIVGRYNDPPFIPDSCSHYPRCPNIEDIHDQHPRNGYEVVIAQSKPIFDLDLKRDDNPELFDKLIGDPDANFLSPILSALSECFDKCYLEDLENPFKSIIVYKMCTTSKLSYHVVFDLVYWEDFKTEGLRFLQALKKSAKLDHNLYACIDPTIYSATRSIRLWGHTKVGGTSVKTLAPELCQPIVHEVLLQKLENHLITDVSLCQKVASLKNFDAIRPNLKHKTPKKKAKIEREPPLPELRESVSVFKKCELGYNAEATKNTKKYGAENRLLTEDELSLVETLDKIPNGGRGQLHDIQMATLYCCYNWGVFHDDLPTARLIWFGWLKNKNEPQWPDYEKYWKHFHQRPEKTNFEHFTVEYLNSLAETLIRQQIKHNHEKKKKKKEEAPRPEPEDLIIESSVPSPSLVDEIDMSDFNIFSESTCDPLDLNEPDRYMPADENFAQIGFGNSDSIPSQAVGAFDILQNEVPRDQVVLFESPYPASLEEAKKRFESPYGKYNLNLKTMLENPAFDEENRKREVGGIDRLILCDENTEEIMNYLSQFIASINQNGKYLLKYVTSNGQVKYTFLKEIPNSTQKIFFTYCRTTHETPRGGNGRSVPRIRWEVKENTLRTFYSSADPRFKLSYSSAEFNPGRRFMSDDFYNYFHGFKRLGYTPYTDFDYSNEGGLLKITEIFKFIKTRICHSPAKVKLKKLNHVCPEYRQKLLDEIRENKYSEDNLPEVPEEEIIYHRLMCNLAGTFVNPILRPRYMLLILGASGSGKGLFASFVKTLFLEYTFKTSRLDAVTGRFNSHLAKLLWLVLDEFHLTTMVDKENGTDRIRLNPFMMSLISEDTFGCEAKYENAEELPHYLHIMALTEFDRFYLPRTDRRVEVLRAKTPKKSDREYFAYIAELISDPDVIKAAAYYLSRYDTSDHAWHVPYSSHHRKKLIDDSAHLLVLHFFTFILRYCDRVDGEQNTKWHYHKSKVGPDDDPEFLNNEKNAPFCPQKSKDPEFEDYREVPIGEFFLFYKERLTKDQKKKIPNNYELIHILSQDLGLPKDIPFELLFVPDKFFYWKDNLNNTNY